MNLLALAVKEIDWDFGVDWLEVPEDKVFKLLATYGQELMLTASKLNRSFLIKWGNENVQRILITPDLLKCIEANSTMNTAIIDDSIFLNPNTVRRLDYSALKAMERLITWNQSGNAAGMVNSKGLQVWVNQKAGILFNDNPENLTAIDTSVYWHPADLHNLYQELKLLDPGKSFEYTYRTRCDEHWDSWHQLTNRFEVVEFCGERYRLSLNLENEAITVPEDLKR